MPIPQHFLNEFISELTIRVLGAKTDDSEVAAHCRMLAGFIEDLLASRKNTEISAQKTGACRHLKQCYEKPGKPEDGCLIQLIESVDESMFWTEGYGSQTGDRSFLDNFSYGEIIGREGIYYNETVSIGLTLIGPNLFYPWHYHPAVELYYPFNENSKWGIHNRALVSKKAGELILHPSMAAHATETGDNPLLALWFWNGDTRTSSKFGSS